MKKISEKQIFNLSKQIQPLILLKHHIMVIEPESLTTPFAQMYSVKNEMRDIKVVAKIEVVCGGKDAEHSRLSVHDVLSQLPEEYYDNIVGYALPQTKEEVVNAYDIEKHQFILTISLYGKILPWRNEKEKCVNNIVY